MNFYEEKKQRRLERAQELAEKNEAKAKQVFNHAHNMADAIPFGQPILVGHYSEKRDRNYRDKIDRTYNKAFELKDKSDYYADKVKAIENNHAISSDDPEAVTKLKTKLEEIDKEIEQVKEHNKKCVGFVKIASFQYRDGYQVITNTNGDSKQYAKIVDGVLIWESKRIPENIKTIIENYHKTGKLEQPELPKDKIKFDSYVLQNLNGNKTRIKKRIEELGHIQTIADYDETKNNIRIFTDKEENRVKIEFPDKPSEEIRTDLKRNGFHWSPYNMCWQKMLNAWSLETAKKFFEVST